MLKFVTHRLAVGVAMMLAVATVVFFVVQSLPGDPVEILLGGDTGSGSVEAVAKLRAEMGLDQSLLVRYLDYIGAITRGDLGTSLTSDTPVAQRIFNRLPNTLELVFISTILGAALGVMFGSFAARRGKGADNAVTALAGVIIAIPNYVVSVLLVLAVSLQLGWLPSGGFVPVGDGFVAHVSRIVLPVIAMTLPICAITSRMARASILGSLEQDWVRTARSLGMPERRVYRRHILRNSLNPILTSVGLQLGALLGGSVVVETIFNWPGVGALLVNSLKERDYPMVQGTVIVLAALLIILNIVVDICYGLLDPRVRSRA